MLNVRIKKIHIHQVDGWTEDFLITEFMIYIMPFGFALPKGSRIFCGRCGEMIGEMKEIILSPFVKEKFNACMTNTNYLPTGHCLKHKDHSMFSGGQQYLFVSAVDYFRDVYRSKSINDVNTLLKNIKEEGDGI